MNQFQPNVYDYLMLIPLAYAAYTDLKIREIPLWLFPSAAMGNILFRTLLYHENYITEAILGAVAMGIPMFLLCLAGKMGGGDLIMFVVIGFILGLMRLPGYLLCACLCSLIVFLITKEKGEIPIAPIAFLSWIMWLARTLLLRRIV